ncbi:MAG: response regulator [Elusimicrobiota bacterium]
MERLRILLVDDEEELVSALVERLRFRSIESKYALNGTKAVAMLQVESFDAVVLDLKLPGISGVDVHSIIKKEYPDLPVILITGHGAPLEQLGFKPGEGCEFLEKPVRIEVLVDKIKDVARKP